MDALPPLPKSFDVVELLRTLYRAVQDLSARVAALEQPPPASAPKKSKEQKDG